MGNRRPLMVKAGKKKAARFGRRSSAEKGSFLAPLGEVQYTIFSGV
jgi:hypothetical protein